VKATLLSISPNIISLATLLSKIVYVKNKHLKHAHLVIIFNIQLMLKQK